jgi:hypothetical protein
VEFFLARLRRRATLDSSRGMKRGVSPVDAAAAVATVGSRGVGKE